MLELVTDATLDLATSEARHGRGCFETLRVERGSARWLDRHLDRLAHGCRFLGMIPPPPTGVVSTFLWPLLQSVDRGALRLIAVDTRLIVRLDPPPPVPPKTIRACISERVVRWSASPLNRFKTLSYLENRLLQTEASERGTFEALALNEAGRLSDGGRTSLFLRKGGRWLTPAASDGALPGIGRGILLEAGLAEEAALAPADFASAQGVVLVNALRGVLPLGEVAGWTSWPGEPAGLALMRAALA